MNVYVWTMNNTSQTCNEKQIGGSGNFNLGVCEWVPEHIYDENSFYTLE